MEKKCWRLWGGEDKFYNCTLTPIHAPKLRDFHFSPPSHFGGLQIGCKRQRKSGYLITDKWSKHQIVKRTEERYRLVCRHTHRRDTTERAVGFDVLSTPHLATMNYSRVWSKSKTWNKYSAELLAGCQVNCFIKKGANL